MANRPRPPTSASRRLGRRVKEEREAHGISVAELAAHLDISDDNLRRVETGDVALTAIRALKIATYLQISIARLYGERHDGAKATG